jgi:hypothetical protein
MTNVAGQGDITNPGSWTDPNGNIPPLAYQNVPQNTSYPLNGDGRYWYEPYAYSATPPIQTFIGDPAFLVAGSMSLQWSIVQAASDGSTPYIAYSTNGGSTYTAVQIGPTLQNNGLNNGFVSVSLAAATGLVVKAYTTGGTSSASATPWQIAIAITRNNTEGLQWDSPNAFNPREYNASRLDMNGQPSATLAQLRVRIINRLGFPNQSANPPPGMAPLVNDFLFDAQAYLWRTFNALQTARFFRWKISPGQRFYSLLDNDEDLLSTFHMDPLKTIEWAGIQDTRNVWYPLIEGIPPQLYTMITKPWRPARYAIRQAIEVYPMPDQTYWLWMRANFGLLSFVNDTDTSTIDSNLIFLHALANAKAHYGQPDANNYETMATSYRGQLIAATHGTSSYIPGTIAVPPAVRPTLIQYQDNQGG